RVLDETAGWISHPRVSPRGDLVAFLDHPQFGDDAGGVAIVDRSGKKTTLARGFSTTQGLAWVPSGEEVWFTGAEEGSNRAIQAVTLAGRRRLLTRSPGVPTLFDVSAEGQALVAHSNERIRIVALTADGKERDLSWLDWSRGAMLSEDGETIVFTEEGEGGGPGYSVFLRKLDGSPAARLGEGEAIAVSRDGKWILAALVAQTPAPL